MLRPDDLVGLPDFRVASLTISPSRRIVESGDRSIAVQPRVMQVLVLLTRVPGAVVTRQGLFDEIWGGVPVGEDSLNRAVAGARRALALDANHLSLETIPRTGYRLHVKHADPPAGRRYSRRNMLVSASLAVVGVGVTGAWSAKSRKDDEFDALLKGGLDALAYGDNAGPATKYFRRATLIDPRSARAQGLFAYSRAYRAESVQGSDVGLALKEAEEAKNIALSRDPTEPYARLADVILRRSSLGFAETENQLRAILETAPQNIEAMRHLWNVLQCVGRSRDALALVERALSVDALAAGTHFPRAQLLWIVGKTAEADRVIDRAIQYWPDHRFVRFARFTIFAFTGRPRAALTMLENTETAPGSASMPFSTEAVALWRTNLAALEDRSPTTVTRARAASLEAARQNLRLASQAVLALSALGEIEAAFDVANELFAVGDSPDNVGPRDRALIKSTAWRFAPWLFIPPTASLRADPRFGPICDSAGLTEYWVKQKVQPDYLTTV